MANLQNMFGAARPSGPSPLVEMKAGKLSLEGTTVTADPRKGVLLVRKSDDNLMHLQWKERNASTVEDDLIVFHGDATLRHLPQCKDGYAMLLEFTTGRRLFFWSQEARKKGLDWAKDADNEAEHKLLKKANGVLNGTAAAPSPAASGMPPLPIAPPRHPPENAATPRAQVRASAA